MPKFVTLPQALVAVQRQMVDQARVAKYPPRKPGFTPVSDIAARELGANGGSLTAVANGRLIRISAGPQDWDVGREWVGREITGWSKRTSLWDKMITVSFHIDLTSSLSKLPMFTLALKPPLTDEEVAMAAETYMMLLNLQRKE
jgi:hypothetical protein